MCRLLLTNLGFRIHSRSLSRHEIMHFYRFYVWLVLFCVFFALFSFYRRAASTSRNSQNKHTYIHTYVQLSQIDGKARQKVRNPMLLCCVEIEISGGRVTECTIIGPFARIVRLSLKCTLAQITSGSGPSSEYGNFI